MQSREHTQTETRLFTASEVADFEYCPLAWWHEHFEPWAQAESEELFARLVELEHEHGAQAPALPEYRLIEQLLLRQGAFEQGHQRHEEHAEAIEDIEEEIAEDRRPSARVMLRGRLLTAALVVLSGLALLFLLLALLLR